MNADKHRFSFFIGVYPCLSVAIYISDLAESMGKIRDWVAGRTDFGQVNGFNPFNPFSKSVDSRFNEISL